MRTPALLLCLALAACGGGTSNQAATSPATSTDAVTEEAVRDTQAAEADAMKAADTELDRLGNSIDDAAPAANAAAASNTTSKAKVVVY